MFSLAYPAVFQPDEDGRILVHFPDFPHAHTDGANVNEATEEAIDCLGSVLAQTLSERGQIPKPSKVKPGLQLVPVPLWIAGKMALYVAMREQGLSNVALAAKLGVRETVVRRMLDPNHDTKSEKLQAALAALGQRVVLRVEKAA